MLLLREEVNEENNDESERAPPVVLEVSPLEGGGGHIKVVSFFLRSGVLNMI